MADRESIIRSALSGLKANNDKGISISDNNNIQQINLISKLDIVVNSKDKSIDEIGETLDLLVKLIGINAKDKAPNNRNNTYRICHGIAKQYGLYQEMRLLMKAQWQAASMRQLTDEQLESLYHFMRALEAYKLQAR